MKKYQLSPFTFLHAGCILLIEREKNQNLNRRETMTSKERKSIRKALNILNDSIQRLDKLTGDYPKTPGNLVNAIYRKKVILCELSCVESYLLNPDG